MNLLMIVSMTMTERFTREAVYAYDYDYDYDAMWTKDFYYSKSS